MKDEEKTKKQLIDELRPLRERISELEASIAEYKKTEEKPRKSYTQLQESRDELIRSEKLAFTGRIAANIAHEIRNPLTNVSMGLQELKKAFEPQSPWAKHLETTVKNTERINFLITELLNCARPPKLNLQPYNVHRVLKGVLESAKTTIESQKVKVETKFIPKPHKVNIDKEQIERAFLNLVSNALEAMPKNRGRLTITTEHDGSFFLVKIQDTGKGIRAEDIIRIFDPFFSTRSGGVGLGLTICYGIIVGHGGTIEVESKPKKGSVFIVALPIG